MPVKRKRGLLKKQETNKIRTRLIEISLKIEDCVYHKIPISMMEAESFIKEVTSYKLECSKDERSLQVIEKLIRCMKAIIIEHQESRTDDCNLCEEVPHVDSGAASPIYSLSDEDRTHMTQELLEPSSVNLFDESTPVYNNSMKDTEEIDSIANNGNKVNAIIHHCDAKDDITMVATKTTGVATSNTTVDVDIQKALSNLSLENVDQEETTFADIECSQSILNNFHELDKLQQNHKSTVESIDTGVIDKTLKTDMQKNFQTFDFLANNPVIIPDARRIANATIFPSSNVNSIDLTKTPIKPMPINDGMRTIKAAIVPSSNVKTVDLTKEINKPLTINDGIRTIKTTVVSSSNVNTVDLTKESTKPLTINDVDKTIKATIAPSPNVATADLNKKSNKRLIIIDTNEKVKATILPSSNIMATEKLNKQLNVRHPPLLNVPDLKNSFSSLKTTTQNVAQPFRNSIPTNTVCSHPIIYNNNITSTNINTICNSYEQYNTASTYNKKIDIKSGVQDNIARKNSPVSVKKKRGPRKNKVMKKDDNLSEKRSSDDTTNKIVKPKIRRARSKKVNAECILIPKDSTIPIYNNFIENDLSWLENIRFVREIREDEIDNKLTYLSENFWDNYDLPSNFDEADFL